MPSRREDIFARLFAVVSGVSGIKTAKRNRIAFDEGQLPAVSVLEGDEEVDQSDANRTRPANRPRIIIAHAQVYLRVMDTDDAGTAMNALRESVIGAIESDAQLAALSVNGRRVSYTTMQSTLHAAREMTCAAALVFDISYLQN